MTIIFFSDRFPLDRVSGVSFRQNKKGLAAKVPANPGLDHAPAIGPARKIDDDGYREHFTAVAMTTSGI